MPSCHFWQAGWVWWELTAPPGRNVGSLTVGGGATQSAAGQMTRGTEGDSQVHRHVTGVSGRSLLSRHSVTLSGRRPDDPERKTGVDRKGDRSTIVSFDYDGVEN